MPAPKKKPAPAPAPGPGSVTPLPMHQPTPDPENRYPGARKVEHKAFSMGAMQLSARVAHLDSMAIDGWRLVSVDNDVAYLTRKDKWWLE